MRELKVIRNEGTLKIGSIRVYDLLAPPINKGKKRPRRMIKQDITKEEFLANLSRVSQPISKESARADSEKSET